MQPTSPGKIVILNGAPRTGKSSVAGMIQDRFEGLWVNLGVDHSRAATPERYQPGIGLRPGGERPDLEPVVVTLYRAQYESIAVHSRLSINAVVDVGHHDDYSVPLGILPQCARALGELSVLFVGVRCPLDVVLERRRRTWGVGENSDPAPKAVMLWQTAVHDPGIYDLEVDTSVLSPSACADIIRRRLEESEPPDAFRHLAAMAARQPGAHRRKSQATRDDVLQ